MIKTEEAYEALKLMLDTNDKVKELNGIIDKSKAIVKEYMKENNINAMQDINDSSKGCTISTTIRQNCGKKTELIAQLKSLGLEQYISITAEPNLKSMQTDKVLNPALDNLYKEYVKEAEVCTLRIK